MNRILAPVVVVIAGGLLAHAAEPGRIFRLEPRPGSAWTLEVASGVGGSATILGRELDVGIRERLQATLVVERIDPEGAAVVLLLVDRLQGIKRAGEEDPVEYDSSDPVRPAVDDETWLEFEKRAASIVGQRWRLIVRPDGAITDVSAEKNGAAVDPLLDHAVLVTSAEVLWLALGGREVVQFPGGPVAVGAMWLHRPVETAAAAGNSLNPAANGRWFGTGEPAREPVFESRYAARERLAERTVDVVTTRRLPPKPKFGLKQDPPVEVAGRLVFDATTGEFVEAAWEGELRSETSAWWMLGKKMAMELSFALRVTPAPAAAARQAQALRPLPPVTR